MFRWIRQVVFFITYALLVAGCATSSFTASTNEFLAERPDGVLRVKDLAPGDRIEVSVEVDGGLEVSPHRAKLNLEGMVTLPLIGDVNVGGMKLADARNIIAETYGAYYVNPPVVMLALVDDDAGGEWGFVTVLGRVNKPGRVPLQSQKGMNLSAAIQMAGGFAPSAKTGNIRVSRIDELGVKTRGSVDFDQIGQAGNAEADIMLIDGDIVYVPERIF